MSPSLNGGPIGAPRRIHVVDDHALSRKHLRTVLGFHGYAVGESASAAEARAALLAAPPELVLMDLQMPGESGQSLLAWMRTEPALAAVPVVCVTASVPQTARDGLQAAGFAAFIAKPVTPPAKLLAVVEAVLGGR